MKSKVDTEVNVYLHEYNAVRDEIVQFEKMLLTALSIYSTIIITIIGISIGKMYELLNNTPDMNLGKILFVLEKISYIRMIFYLVPYFNSTFLLTTALISFTIWKASNYISNTLSNKINQHLKSFICFGWERLQGNDKILMILNGLPVIIGTFFVLIVSLLALNITYKLEIVSEMENYLWLGGFLITVFTIYISVILLIKSAIEHPGDKSTTTQNEIHDQASKKEKAPVNG